jgi:hypothetical protein
MNVNEIITNVNSNEVNNCYCCFNETNYRSPCKCKAYICKKCFKKYKKYESGCKICNTEFIIEETCKDKLIRKYKDSLNRTLIYCDHYLTIFCLNLLSHPCCLILISILPVAIIICGPPFIYSLLISLITNSEFTYIFTIGTWLIGIFIFIIISLFISICICIISIFISYFVYLLESCK